MYWATKCGIVVFMLQCMTIGAQSFENLDLTQLCDSLPTGLCHWELSWGAENAVRPESPGDIPCLVIEGQNPQSVGFVEQSSTYTTPEISILQFSAEIRSTHISGKGAGLNVGLYDSDNNLIATRDMGGFYSVNWIQGTTDWKRYDIEIVVPEVTSKIKIGAIFYGQGQAYFRELRVSIIPIEGRKGSTLAEKYLEIVIDTISQHSLYRDSLAIEDLQRAALAIAGDAQSYKECHLAVNFLLESLRTYGDNHSFLMTSAEYENWKETGSQVSKIEYAKAKKIDSIGYIEVPPFHGGNQDMILAFADSLQHLIKELYEKGVKGWIVDLRSNTGGNMGPMVAGLGPLFSHERLGSLIDVNGVANHWYYQRGAYFWDKEEPWSVTHPVTLPKQLPIAVLISNRTGSSGEAVVVSFIGNARTRFFGQPTWGLTTGNGEFALPDGSRIFLASTIYADRDGNKFHGPIEPDTMLEDGSSTSYDEVLQAAIEWVVQF